MRAVGCEASMLDLVNDPASWVTERCTPKHDSGTDPFTAWNTCRTTKCVAACGRQTFEPDWACLGHIEQVSPKLDLQSLSFDVAVNDAPKVELLPSVAVSACSGRFEPCVPSGRMEPDGFIQVGFPHPSLEGVFFDYLRLVPTSGSSFAPTLDYEFPPVTQTGVDIAALVASTGAPPPGVGVVVIVAYSCGLNFPATGATFEASVPDAQPIKNLPGLPPGGGAFAIPVSGDAGAATTGSFSVYRGSDGGKGPLVFEVNQARVEAGGVTFIIATPSPPGGW
jgi:hypothetical protein